MVITMLKACGKCGQIHDRKHICTPSQKYKKYKSDKRIDDFRNSQAWKDKTKEIKARDGHMCQACLHELPGTMIKYNGRHLSVHHITPLKADFERRFDNDNLITLCRCHHEQAERGTIPAAVLRKLLTLEDPPLG